jgi:hypothetical protein
VEKPTPSKTNEENLKAGAIGAPATLVSFAPTDRKMRMENISVGYSERIACLLTARSVEPAEKAIAKERLRKKTRVTRRWLSERHVTTATLTYATIEELLEEMFFVRSAPRLYNENESQLPGRRIVLCCKLVKGDSFGVQRQ